jgi:RND family efflux transporter MFP subunit
VQNVDAGSLQETQISEVRKNLQYVQVFLNDLNAAVALMGEGIRDQSINVQYRTDIAQARQSVNTAVQAFNSAATAYKNSQSSLSRAQDQLKIKQEGKTSDEIAAQRAQTQSAAAGVSSAAASLDKTRLVAPFDGVVTRIAYKEGESVALTDVVVTLMSDAAFEVETFVSENDAPKLKIGQKASVTLDALGDAIIFDATISQVDLSETIKDGVVTYKTRAQFVSKDERIKSGLTANVTVESDRRTDVLTIPQSAVVIEKGKKLVKVVSSEADVWSPAIDKQAILRPIKTGGIDRDGNIELISGVSSGDKVIVLVKKSK